MNDEKKPNASLLPSPGVIDDRVLTKVEDEITNVIDKLLRPYLLETIPVLMRKLNHQGVFDKLVRTHLEQLLKTTLDDYCERTVEGLTVKIDKKFKETILSEFEPRIEQAAKKLLDDKLAKLRAEFGK